MRFCKFYYFCTQSKITSCIKTSQKKHITAYFTFFLFSSFIFGLVLFGFFLVFGFFVSLFWEGVFAFSYFFISPLFDAGKAKITDYFS